MFFPLTRSLIMNEFLLSCKHCLLPVSEKEAVCDESLSGRTVFCCHACRAIYRMITEEGLGDFYRRRDWKSPGIPESLRRENQSQSERPAQELEALAPFIRGDGDIKEADLMLDGIRCASCVWLNEKVLERTNGIISACVNFATHRALVKWDSTKITLGRIIARIRSIGYLARPYTRAAHEESLKKQNYDLLVRLGTAFFFSMQLMMLSFGLYAGFFQGIDPETKRRLEFAAFIVCTPVLFYSGWPFLRGAFHGIRNRALNMDVLVSLGALSAYFLSIHHMLTGGEVYFDTSAMIMTLVLLGRYLENSAKRKASQAVERLLALQPQDARVIRGRERTMMSINEVKKEDLVEIRPGEKIPLDGVVVEGLSETDEALVTGESRPVEKSPGSGVIGGSMNGLGALVIQVTRAAPDATIAQIARLVENAQAAAASIQRVADRVSAYFIPFVLSVAGATFFYWSGMQGAGSYSTAMLNAVSVLVIACPCALGLATPVAILSGTGSAARRGILIKGGDVLERMHKVDTVIMDKTGTLTTGKMNVVEVRTVEQADRVGVRNGNAVASVHNSGIRNHSEIRNPKSEIVLQYAASAEQGSEHLLGAAIADHAKEQGTPLLKAEGFKAVPGQGVRAMIAGLPVLVGKRMLLEKEDVVIYPEIAAEAEALEHSGRTVLFVARNKALLGIIALMDSPKPDAAQAVAGLQDRGVDVVMITGDNQTTARVIAEGTGIRHVLSGILPSGKADEIRRLRSKGNFVAMVGDGINDAPALAAADVGIAMSAGSDIAIESADVVLLRSGLLGVVDAFDLSRRTFRVIKQNLFWAFFYNVAALPLAVSGVLNPIVAAAAMAVSSVAVVTNSLRIR